LSKKPSAGSIVEARCTRCRSVLNHTIVAMVGEQIVRVECNTCHGTHNYHAVKEDRPAKTPAGTGAKKSAAPRTSRLDPSAAARDEWAALQPMDPARSVPYDMAGRYRVNDLIHHPTFGLGIVQTVLPNKIEILFKDGKKLLRCG
jgi:hypothetical protein